MIQRLRDAATLLFLGALVMTIKVTPVETLDAMAPDVHAAGVLPAESLVLPAVDASPAETPSLPAAVQPRMLEFSIPVAAGEAHAVIDLESLAAISQYAGDVAEQIIILKIDRETRTMVEGSCETDIEEASPGRTVRVASDRC